MADHRTSPAGGAEVPRAAAPGRGLKRFIMLLTAAVGTLVIVFGATSYVILDGLLARAGEVEQVQRARVIREVLEQRLAFYHDIVRGYARDPAVRDLIAFQDAAGALSWSARVRDSLPQAIGAALFTAEGQVLGEAAEQRIGERCLLDLRQRAQGQAQTLLPLHDDILALAHFDVSTPVRDSNGDVLGLIFVSFTVKELLLVLDRVSSEYEAAALIDADNGKQIAASPNWTALADSPEMTENVAGSDWELRIRLAPGPLLPALPVIGGIILVGASAVILLMVLAGRFFIRRYVREVQDIESMLERILAGEAPEQDGLHRAGHFFPRDGDLRTALAELGSRHRELQRDSHTDDLTGLTNRLGFDRGLDALLALRRNDSDGAGFSLVLLRLDDVQSFTAGHGHAAAEQVLRAFARALQRSVRSGDLASRWEGEAFAALLPQMPPDRLLPWLERLRETFDEELAPLAVAGGARRCRASAGFAYVAPGDGRDAGALIREADERLRRDQAEHRG